MAVPPTSTDSGAQALSSAELAAWQATEPALDAVARLGGLAACRRLASVGSQLVRISPSASPSLPVGESVLGGCLASGRAVVAGATEERLHARERAMMGEVGADYLLAVPVTVRSGERPAGVVAGLKRSPLPAEASEQALGALLLLAEQIALRLRIAESEHRLRSANEQMVLLQGEAEGILHAVRAPALVLTAAGRLHDANRAAEVLLGFQLPRSRGLLLSEIIDEPSLAEALGADRRAAVSAAPQVRIHRPDEMVLEVRVTPVFDAHGELRWRVVVLNDTTTIRQADELKSEFISAVSHELRTPLTSIKAFASTLLRADHAKPEDRREWLTIIDSECDRLTALINDLLVISQYDDGRGLVLCWGEVDLMDLVRDVAGTEGTAAHRHTIQVTGPSQVKVVADGARLKQVIANLVSNAVKYSPRGGRVDITVEEAEDEVHLLVRDQGVGIRPEHLNLVFERFFQVDGSTTRRTGGTGLGLYLTRLLVEAHGGSVWAESELGKGSTFVVRLPRRPHLAVQ